MMRKKKRMRSVRGQHLPLPDLLLVHIPHEYDEVMGITQVEPRDAERFEQGKDSDFQDAEETAPRETETGDQTESEARGPGGNPWGKKQRYIARMHRESSATECCCPCYPPLWGRN